jgi:hypothetical protein
MNRVAQAECATCHIIRPKTEMRPVRVRRKSGSSFGFWGSRYSGDSGYHGNRTGQSYRTSYSHQEAWVCKGCKKPRSDWTPVHYTALGIAALILLALFSGRSSTDEAAQKQFPVENAAVDTDSSSVAAASSVPKEEALASDNALTTRTENNAESAAPVDTPSSAPFDFTAAEVADAEAKAVQTGRPIRWNSAGYSGYAVPSAAVANASGAECRNVYSTASIDGVEQRSPVQQMCSPATAAP